MKPAAPLSRMFGLFATEGLPCPPVPHHLAGRLRLERPRWFSTETVSDWPYYFRTYLERLNRPRAEDLITIAFAGHGVNAYGLSYYMVLGELRILLQLAWGDSYLPEEAQRAGIATVFGALHEVWPSLGRSFATRHSITPSVFACSDFWGGLIQLRGLRLELAPRTQPDEVAGLIRSFARAAEDR